MAHYSTQDNINHWKRSSKGRVNSMQDTRSWTQCGDDLETLGRCWPKFDGSKDEFFEWVDLMDRKIEAHGVNQKEGFKLATSQLRGYAFHWFKSVKSKRALNGNEKIKTWDKLKSLMVKHFVPKQKAHPHKRHQQKKSHHKNTQPLKAPIFIPSIEIMNPTLENHKNSLKAPWLPTLNEGVELLKHLTFEQPHLCSYDYAESISRTESESRHLEEEEHERTTKGTIDSFGSDTMSEYENSRKHMEECRAYKPENEEELRDFTNVAPIFDDYPTDCDGNTIYHERVQENHIEFDIDPIIIKDRQEKNPNTVSIPLEFEEILTTPYHTPFFIGQTHYTSVSCYLMPIGVCRRLWEKCLSFEPSFLNGPCTKHLERNQEKRVPEHMSTNEVGTEFVSHFLGNYQTLDLNHSKYTPFFDPDFREHVCNVLCFDAHNTMKLDNVCTPHPTDKSVFTHYRWSLIFGCLGFDDPWKMMSRLSKFPSMESFVWDPRIA